MGDHGNSIIGDGARRAGHPLGIDHDVAIAGLISDSTGALYGTTSGGGNASCSSSPTGCGTVFEIAGSDFAAPPARSAGTLGNANCYGQSVAALVRQYGGLNAAAVALGYSSVKALQNAIMTYCGE